MPKVFLFALFSFNKYIKLFLIGKFLKLMRDLRRRMSESLIFLLPCANNKGYTSTAKQLNRKKQFYIKKKYLVKFTNTKIK